ncbi:hypothetical protein [Hymenobacter rigui]|nr:hypothetical protein [Hymenobacter rigui]
MSRKSRPKSPFLNYVMGNAAKNAFVSGVPNCTTCKSPRTEVKREDIPEETWNTGLAPLWQMMEEQGQSPAQIAHCPKCGDYGILGGWASF